MGHIKIEELQTFANSPVEVAIVDVSGNERAPFVNKTIKKIEVCPDGTHVRFYFNDFHFFAVPIGAETTENSSEWSAFDADSELRYTIRKV